MIEQHLNIAEQRHRSLLVSKIHKTALFVFIATLLASVLLGTAMTVLAFRGMYRGSRNVQARLSILGLVSSRFEPPSVSGVPAKQGKDLFEESKADREGVSRIGLLNNDNGGWSFESWYLKDESESNDGEDGIPLVGLQSGREDTIIPHHEDGDVLSAETGTIQTV